MEQQTACKAAQPQQRLGGRRAQGGLWAVPRLQGSAAALPSSASSRAEWGTQPHCQFAMKIGISVLPHEHWGEIHGAQSSGHSWMCPIPSLTEPWAREQQTWHAKGTGIPQNKPIKKGTDTQRGSGRSWPAIPSRLWVLLLPFPALCLGLERWMTGTAQFSC